MNINEVTAISPNWSFPNQETLQADFNEYKKKEDRKWKQRAIQIGARFPIFDNIECFVKCLKDAQVKTINDSIDATINNRSMTSSIEDLKDLVGSYYKPRDVDRIINGFKTGANIPYPIVIEGSKGSWILAGNTRLDVAGIMELQKKVLWVDVSE